MTGALFGYAAASEYVLAAILMIPVFWAMLRVRPRRDSAAHRRGGAAPWLIATALYNVAAFETPLPVGYRYSAFAGAFECGVFGFAAPSWDLDLYAHLQPLSRPVPAFALPATCAGRGSTRCPAMSELAIWRPCCCS